MPDLSQWTSIEVPSLHRSTLPNGLEVIVSSQEGAPLVTVEIAIRAGSFVETPELDGLAHLHEHMFFKANRALPDQPSYLRRLDELGASWNGSTSHELVRYHFTLPHELLREGLVFLRDAIQSPLFREDELEKERRVVLSEYDRNEANPHFHLYRAIERALFWKYPSRKNVIGSREVIATCTREKLQFIQDTFYVPNNAALILTGRLDTDLARNAAEEIFGEWQRRPDPFKLHPVPRHPAMERDAFLVIEKDVRTATAMIAWQGPSVGEDLPGAAAADVIATAVNHPSSALRRALVDSGLAARVQMSYHTSNQVGTLMLEIEGEPETILEAVSRARERLDALAQPGAHSQRELTRAARELITQEALDREKGLSLALSVAFWWAIPGLDAFLDASRLFSSVRPADVAAFARRYLPSGGARTALAVLVSPEGARRVGITAAAIERAFLPQATERRESAALPPARRALHRAGELITAQTGARAVASFQLCFPGHAARSSAALAGLEEALLRVVADRLERVHGDELAALGVHLRLQSLPDFSTLGFTGLASGLERGAELVLSELRDMSFVLADLDRVRARMLAAYAQSLDHPDSEVGYVVNRTFLPALHPYFAYPGGTDDSLKRLTVEHLAERREALVRGRRALAVAAGDVDGDAIAALCREILGGPRDEARGDSPEGADAVFVLPAVGGGPARLTVEERAIPTAYVLGRFRAPAPGEHDYEALSLALSILHRRLFIEVRTRRALTYAVASGVGERAGNSGYLYVTTQSPTEALRVMFETLDSLLETPLDAEELRGSTRAHVTRTCLRQESAAELADALARETLVAGDPARVRSVAERFAGVDAAEVRRVLREWVREIHFAVLGPADLLGKLDRGLFTSR